MEENKNFQTRKQIRLKEYDYSQEGMYFITICTQDRKHVLSKIIKEYVGAGLVSARVRLTNIGHMIETEYLNLEKEFENIKIHDYVVMPNHMHFIIEIYTRADTRPAPTISNIICSFKSRTTVKILKDIKNKKYENFNKRFWQRNYYEHIIRNEKELYKIKEYIQYNPLNWEKDKYNC